MKYMTVRGKKRKKIQHSENGKQGKENPNTLAIFIKAFKKKRRSKSTKSVLTYWTQKYNQVSYFVQYGPLKSMFDIICRIFTIHIHRGHLRHLILQYHSFAFNRGYDAQLQSKA